MWFTTAILPSSVKDAFAQSVQQQLFSSQFPSSFLEASLYSILGVFSFVDGIHPGCFWILKIFSPQLCAIRIRFPVFLASGVQSLWKGLILRRSMCPAFKLKVSTSVSNFRNFQNIAEVTATLSSHVRLVLLMPPDENAHKADLIDLKSLCKSRHGQSIGISIASM